MKIVPLPPIKNRKFVEDPHRAAAIERDRAAVTLLNGEPVEVEITITVNFTLAP